MLGPMVAKGPLRQVFAQSLRRVPDPDHNGRSNFPLLTKSRHGLIQAPIDTDERFLRLKQVLAIMHVKDCIQADIALVVIRWQPDLDSSGIDELRRHTWKMMQGADQIGVFDWAQNRLNFCFTLCAIIGSFATGLDIVNGFEIHNISSQPEQVVSLRYFIYNFESLSINSQFDFPMLDTNYLRLILIH